MRLQSILRDIESFHRKRVDSDGRNSDKLLAEALLSDLPLSFSNSIIAQDSVGIIAEFKRRSPSEGVIITGKTPVEMATQYLHGGASAISVLTDEKFFGGSIKDLQAIVQLQTLPILRKDFALCVNDVYDARIAGASAILIVLSIMSDVEAQTLLNAASQVGIDALVECHGGDEIERAKKLDARLIGINQRDLSTFTVDAKSAAMLAAKLPSDVIKVAESGITCPADMYTIADAGFDAALIGTSLLRSENVTETLRALKGAGKKCS